MIKSTFRLLIGLALLLTSALSVSAQDDSVPRYEPLDDCFIEMPEDVAYDCGNVIVPEFYDGRTDNTFSLGVIRLLSTSDEPEEPIFFGAGGPGGTLLPTAPAAAQDPDFYGRLLANHDLVFFAQRGTVHSEPYYLTCEGIDAGQDLILTGGTWDEVSQAKIEGLKGCYDDYVASGVDFAAFNSLEIAADVNSIREVFDYDKMIYYGESYGTLLGQHIMREYPEMLAAVVLDGVVPISNPSWETNLDRRYETALGYIVDLCAADTACNEAYPNLEEDINTVYQRLQNNPDELPLGDDLTIFATSGLFATAVYNAMYQYPLVQQIPAVVNWLSTNEQTELAAAFMGFGIPSAGTIAWSMHYAMVCQEDPISSLDEALSLESLRFDMIPEYIAFDANDYIAMCDHMDLETLPEETDVPISSELPVLVINGAFDPVTPELYALPITETLPNSYSVTLAYGDHVNATGDACAQSIMLQFLADPATEPDSSCTTEPGPFRWILP